MNGLSSFIVYRFSFIVQKVGRGLIPSRTLGTVDRIRILPRGTRKMQPQPRSDETDFFILILHPFFGDRSQRRGHDEFATPLFDISA
jgi:hypothetical protein